MKTAIAMIVLSMIFGTHALAATFVYVSNADDGEIRTYTLQADGSLKPGQTAKAEKIVMPMVVTPDKRFLIAAVRSKPYRAYSYAIDQKTGELSLVGTGPLAESFPYISLDRGGRFLFGASYGANLVSVNPVGADGRIGEPMQVVPTARNAHSIRIDNSNHFVFVPHLGTDQVFQFLFDEKSGRLTANTPPVLQLQQGTGPRHLVVSQDNRFIYLLSELTGTVTTLGTRPRLRPSHGIGLGSCPASGFQAGGRNASGRGRHTGSEFRLPATLITISGPQTFTSPRMAAFFTPASARRAPLGRSASTVQPES